MTIAADREQTAAAHDEAARQQARADARAQAIQQADGTLLGLAFAGLAVAKPGPAGTVLGGLAMVCLVTSFLVVYVGATRPRLGDRSYGFPLWADKGLSYYNAPRSETDAARVQKLSRRTVEIFEATTIGGDLTAAGLVLLAITAAVTGSGH